MASTKPVTPVRALSTAQAGKLPSGWYMRTKYPQALLHSAHLAITAGTHTATTAAKALGASYSPVWLYTTWATHKANGTLVSLANLTPTKANAKVAKLRAMGLSWGAISAMVAIPEAAVRKQYSQATGKQHMGTRTGAGGRYWGGNAALYSGTGKHGNRATSGTVTPAGTTATQAAKAVAAKPNAKPTGKQG